MKKSTLFFFSLILVLSALNLYITANKKLSLNTSSSLLSCEDLLEHANRLSSKKIYAPAAKSFEAYLDRCGLQAKDAAITYLRVADLYFDSKDYGQALSAYYLAETLDSDLKKFTSEKIVNTLENLNLSKEARFEQEKRVALDQESVVSKGKAIARIGKTYIYEDALDELMADMPAELKKMSKNPQIRATLLQQYVMQEAMLAKALRMGLDKEPLVSKTLEMTKKQLLVKYLMDKEISDKASISDDELKAAYEKEKASFSSEASLALRYKALEKNDKLPVLKKELQKSDSELIWIDSSFTYIPELGEAEETIEKLFKLDEKSFLEKESIEGQDYLIYIVEKKDKETKSFDEVKENLRTKYSKAKQEQLSSDFITKIMQEEDVEIY